MGFAIYLKDAPIEQFDDLLTALRRSRTLAERLNETLDIRDEHDMIMAVTVSTKKTGDGLTMTRANKHNLQRTLELLKEMPDERCGEHAQHDWQTEPPSHQSLFRCLRCNVLGYSYLTLRRPMPLKCSICGKPATKKRDRKVLKHRWGCEKHADS